MYEIKTTHHRGVRWWYCYEMRPLRPASVPCMYRWSEHAAMAACNARKYPETPVKRPEILLRAEEIILSHLLFVEDTDDN